jgi:AcrR family transcriptional regulator
VAARKSLGHDASTEAALPDAPRPAFAVQGPEAASLRAIRQQAGFTAETMQYHFGSKQELLDALLARERAGIGGKISELAASLAAQNRPPTAEQIVAAIAMPYVDFVRSDPVGGPHHLKVLAQVIHTDDVDSLPSTIQTMEPVQRAVNRAYPNASREEACYAMAVASRSLLSLLAGVSIDTTDRGRDKTNKADIAAIIRFVAGGLSALMKGTER